MKLPMLAAAVSAAAVLSVLPVSSAYAVDTVTITYFTIGSNDQDANHLGSGTVNNEVQNMLGPNGLPVLNTAAFGCSSNCFALAGPNDVLPTGLPASVPNPLHRLALVAMGINIFDNLDFERAVEQARRLNRYEFLFSAAPLRIEKGTGSPLNPLAIF